VKLCSAFTQEMYNLLLRYKVSK